MKILTLFLVLMFGLTAYANTQFIVAKGGSKATVLVIGSPSDHEAWRFYETLTAEAKDFNGKWSKVFLFDNSSGERVMSASCVFSKVLKENGTCTVTIFPVAGVTIDSSGRSVEYISPDSGEAARVAEGFEAADSNGLVYTNDNGRFRVEARVLKGVVEAFSLTYK